jgi:GNAT superfamily N-acetyltransferase
VSLREISIRQAVAKDVPFIVTCLRRMLADMASVGGHPVAVGKEAWSRQAVEFEGQLRAPECLHLLAETADREPVLVGWAFARQMERDPVFEPARVLHVHALYVSPDCRCQGIGGKLLEALLEWGREIGCSEAELNVLAGNPARSLYAKLGFRAFEVEMTRKL